MGSSLSCIQIDEREDDEALGRMPPTRAKSPAAAEERREHQKFFSLKGRVQRRLTEPDGSALRLLKQALVQETRGTMARLITLWRLTEQVEAYEKYAAEQAAYVAERAARRKALRKPKHTECSSGNGFTCAVSCTQGRRPTMEDAHILNCSLSSDFSLFAVFDGHGGTP